MRFTSSGCRNCRAALSQVFLLLFTIAFYGATAQQIPAGRVVSFIIQAKTLQNSGGENPNRKVSVYLPPGYEQSGKRFPVIYYLHGYSATDSIYSSMKLILDRAISERKIRPFILVQPNEYTLFEGSFYGNSSLTGNWSDFTAKELVEYVDKNFKTMAHRDSRAIAGHSMGGHGALKLAMLYPDVFSSVYALSPGLLALVKEFGPNSDSFRDLQKIQTADELKKSYYPKVLVACGRTWSPNAGKPPFYCDMPFTYERDSLVINQRVVALWKKNMPLYMLDDYADNLRKLKAIKFDWGRNDSPRFPVQCGMFSQSLENLGINHYAEEYIGTHVNKIWTVDGRVLNDLLPFFNDYLKFN
jgi:pimeloyl-ACP methyl ester carboxylesterase